MNRFVAAVCAVACATTIAPAGQLFLSLADNIGNEINGNGPFTDNDMVNTADAVPLFSLNGGDLDAFHILDNGNYLLSSLFNGDAGGNIFDDGDLVEYNPFTNTIVGNYLGIGNSAFATTGEDITAATTDEQGNLYFSTLSDATLNHAGGALSFTDGDVVKVDAATGVASIFIAEADLWDDGDSDVYGLHWMGDGTMLVTSNSDELVNGTLFLDGDIFQYDLATGAASLFFSESNFTSSNTHDVDAIYYRIPAPSSALALAGLALAGARRRR